MTTIAVNNTEIAGDRQATHSAGMKFRLKTKVHKFEASDYYPVAFYVGMAGNLENFADIVDFFTDPSKWKKAPTLKRGGAVVLDANGKIWTFSRPNVWIPIDQPFYAIGSGMLYAMGAMEQGASPKEAVKTAAKHDPNTGMGVTSFSFDR